MAKAPLNVSLLITNAPLIKIQAYSKFVVLIIILSAYFMLLNFIICKAREPPNVL